MEQICFLCAIALLSVGFGLLILLIIPQVYFWLHLSFWHFVASLILLATSGLLMVIRQFYRWHSEGYSLDEWRYPSIASRANVNSYNSPLLGQSNVGAQLQTHKVEKLEAVEPPTREQLGKLKGMLGIEKGSLQYKKRGQGVYHVIYSEGKHNWNHLGTWKELKQKLDV